MFDIGIKPLIPWVGYIKNWENHWLKFDSFSFSGIEIDFFTQWTTCVKNGELDAFFSQIYTLSHTILRSKQFILSKSESFIDSCSGSHEWNIVHCCTECGQIVEIFHLYTVFGEVTERGEWIDFKSAKKTLDNVGC